jgi:Kef-type K+ transport system membrane component KefB
LNPKNLEAGWDGLMSGLGMVPRGGVNPVFAATGKALGVTFAEIFSMMVMVIMLTTLLPAPVLSFLLKRRGITALTQTNKGRW